MFYECLFSIFLLITSLLLSARCFIEGGWKLVKLFLQLFLPGT